MPAPRGLKAIALNNQIATQSVSRNWRHYWPGFFWPRRVSDLIEINELNADASELDNANPDSWSAMPKVAKDFQSLRLRDDEVDEPAGRDDSELEDYDGIAVF